MISITYIPPSRAKARCWPLGPQKLTSQRPSEVEASCFVPQAAPHPWSGQAGMPKFFVRRVELSLEKPRVERHLAAILAADVAGYSRLMGADEGGTLAR